MRNLTKLQWLGAMATMQLLVAAAITGVGFDSPSHTGEVKVLGATASKEKTKDNGTDKRTILAGGTIPGLYPGAVLDLAVTLRNPNNFDVAVTELAAAVDHASSTCKAVNVMVDDFAGRRLVPKNGSAVQTLVVRMHHDAPDACKNVAWQLAYSGRAEKDKP